MSSAGSRWGRAASTRRSSAFVSVALALAFPPLLAGCPKKRAEPVLEPLPPLAPSAPARPGPLSFEKAPSAGGVGLPRGCSLREPVVVARARSKSVLFFAADGQPSELVLADPAGGPEGGLAAGLLPLPSGSARPLAHFEPERPPLFAWGEGAGWLSLFTRPGRGTSARAALWREGARAEAVAEGDALEAADLRCRGKACAALVSRPLKAAAPGAEVIAGEASAPFSSWARAEVFPEGAEPDRPFMLADVGPGPGEAWATTTDGASVQFFKTHGAKNEAGPRLSAPFGPLDAIKLARPLVLAHGAKVEGLCARPRPKLAIVREGLPAVDLTLDAPVLSLFARPLSRGALVAWLTPAACGEEQRRVVYAMLLDDDGSPRGSAMAVSDSTGFALSTRGDDADLWLLRGADIVWIRARCSPGG